MKVLVSGKLLKPFLRKGKQTYLNPRVANALKKGEIAPMPRYVWNKKTNNLIPIYQGNSNKISKEFRDIKRKAQLVFPTNTYYDMTSRKIISSKKIFKPSGERTKAFKDKKIVGNRIIRERKKKDKKYNVLVSYVLNALVQFKDNAEGDEVEKAQTQPVIKNNETYYKYQTIRTFNLNNDYPNMTLQQAIKKDIENWIKNYYNEGIASHYYENEPQDHIRVTKLSQQKIPITEPQYDFDLNAKETIYLNIEEKEEWNTNQNKCVYDFIIWRYGNINGCKKICKFEKLWELFNCESYQPLMTEEEYYNQDEECFEDHNTEYYDSETGEWEEQENDTYEDYCKRYFGVNINGIKRFCAYLRIPMYALNQDKEIIEYFYPKDRRGDYNIPPMCYKVVNNHLYPIIDEAEVKSIGQKASEKTNCIKPKADDEVKKEFNMIELYNTDPYEHIVNEMKKRNIQVVNENVKMNGSNILSYSIENDKYIFINDADDNYGKRYMEAIGQKYQGEHITSICSNYINENITEISTPNHIVNELLFREGVKHRVQLGIIDTNYEPSFFANYGKYKTITSKKIIEKEVTKELPITKQKPLTHMELFLQYKREKQTKKIIVREEIECEEEVNWNDYSCYDINKCYSKCITDPYDKFIILDFNALPEHYTYDEELPLGLFFVETNDTTLFHKSNIYSTSIVRYGLAEGIIQHNNIKWVIRASKVLPKDYFKYLFDLYANDCKKDKKLNKIMNNLTTGLLGKSFWRRSTINISSSIEEAFCYLQKYQDRKCFVRNCDDIYIYGNKKEKQLQEHNIPIYIQILDDSNIRLYELAKKCGGELIYRKTDCVVVKNCNDIETGTEWGQYSEEKYPMVMFESNDDKRSVNGACDYLDSDIFGYHHITDITDSSDWKKIVAIIEDGNGLMINGDAGTGKSYVIKNVAKYFESKNIGVAKLCFTNKGAINIGGQTIHKFMKLDDQGRVSEKRLDAIKDHFGLIIIDEVSMVSSFLWKRLFELKKKGLKFLLVGDWKQIPPVEPNMKEYDYMTHPAVIIMSDAKLIVLEKIHRYDMKLKRLSNNVDKIKTNRFPNKVSKRNICYTNKTRKYVNKLLNDLIAKDFTFVTIPVNKIKEKEKVYNDPYSQEIKLHKGVPLISRVTDDRRYGIVNNEEFIVTAITKEKVTIQSIRPNDNGEPEKYVTEIDIKDLQKCFALAYCITTHKSQGSTIEGKLTIWDWEKMDTRLRYTAITRATAEKYINFQTYKK